MTGVLYPAKINPRLQGTDIEFYRLAGTNVCRNSKYFLSTDGKNSKFRGDNIAVLHADIQNIVDFSRKYGNFGSSYLGSNARGTAA